MDRFLLSYNNSLPLIFFIQFNDHTQVLISKFKIAKVTVKV